MESKTEQAVKLWLYGERRQALRIFKTFKIGLTSEDRRSIQIAAESLDAKMKDQYERIGVDTEYHSYKAAQIIEEKFVKRELSDEWLTYFIENSPRDQYGQTSIFERRLNAVYPNNEEEAREFLKTSTKFRLGTYGGKVGVYEAINYR